MVLRFKANTAPDASAFLFHPVEHYGREAIGIAQDRVEELRNSGDYLVMDVALRVLTQCELLLDKGRRFEPTGDWGFGQGIGIIPLKPSASPLGSCWLPSCGINGAGS